MTAAPQPQHQPVTDGGDARMRVRAADHLRLVSDSGIPTPGSAHARVISDDAPTSKTEKPSKVRNFASQHAGEAATAAGTSWLGSERPQSLAAVAKGIGDLPGGFGLNAAHIAAGVIRLGVYGIAYLILFAFDTNVRVLVSTSLTIAVIAAAALVGLTGQ